MHALLGAEPKAAGSFDRTRSLDETLDVVPAVRARFGITRVAELTHLDRIGIPVYGAIVPDSAELISVYNGKGVTREAALLGAVMEAAERQAAANPTISTWYESSIDGEPVESLAGYDLIKNSNVVLPVACVCAPRRTPFIGQPWSSNGLAAGNTYTEAVLHALYELIERHLWSVADALAHRRPLAILERLVRSSLAVPGFVDDPIASEIALPTGAPEIDRLVEKLRVAGLTVRLRAIDALPLPALFVATVCDEDCDRPTLYAGLGCSLSPEHAAIRALTEAVQSRAFDFHATREDLLQPNGPSSPYGEHNRRGRPLPVGRWYFDAPSKTRQFSSFADLASNDLAQDVAALVDGLISAGVSTAVIVDLSPSDLPITIVRAVIPELESTLVDGRIGATVARVLDLAQSPPDLSRIQPGRSDLRVAELS